MSVENHVQIFTPDLLLPPLQECERVRTVLEKKKLSLFRNCLNVYLEPLRCGIDCVCRKIVDIEKTGSVFLHYTGQEIIRTEDCRNQLSGLKRQLYFLIFNKNYSGQAVLLRGLEISGNPFQFASVRK